MDHQKNIHGHGVGTGEGSGGSLYPFIVLQTAIIIREGSSVNYVDMEGGGFWKKSTSLHMFICMLAL